MQMQRGGEFEINIFKIKVTDINKEYNFKCSNSMTYPGAEINSDGKNNSDIEG